MDEEDLFLEEEDYDHSFEEESYNYEEEPDLQQESSRKPTSQVITKESLVVAQKEDLVKVMELLSVKENQARILLIHYQWNVDKLFSIFADQGIDRLFSCAGLTILNRSMIKSKRLRKKMKCDICMEDDLPSNVMTRMDCGHSFCNDCWEGHFTVKINEGESKMIRCMALKCNAICDEDVVRKLIRPELAEKFDRFLLESYVEDNKMVKWCPSTPHCGNAIRKLQGGEVDEVDEFECSCGHQFCFRCLSESHSPCSCLMWKLWTEKCVNESETVNWIAVNTKLCPKCNKAVEKRDGCNLIRCICGQCFCWLCGGATGSDHTYLTIKGHSCGRYKDDKVKQLERAKRDLNRYTHYYHRYKAHTDSSKLEGKLRKSIFDKAVFNSETKDQAMFNVESWVTDGANRLFRSRRVLLYSYPFAFYMFGHELFKDDMSDKEREIKKNLFEDQQQQLEGNVEKLSRILEDPSDRISCQKVVEMKQHVKNLSDVVDKLCKQMYECIENELLGPIHAGIHNIAPYRSEGIQQAAEFCADIG